MSRAPLIQPLLLLLAGFTIGSSCLQETRPIVGAAASLRAVMPELAAAFEAEHDVRAPELTYGASGTLAKQIQAGAPLSALVLASATDMDALTHEGLIERGSKTVIATNRLVLAGRVGDAPEPLQFLTKNPSSRIAMGDPRFVPAGAHAREALQARGVWDRVAPRTIFTRDVTAAMALLRRGEVDWAFIYDTDVRLHEELEVVERFEDTETRRPTVITGSAPGSQEVRAFLTFLSGSRAAEILRAHGFQVDPQ
ncbi:MAG: molybdate ABC transporter substrate-binding protein [Deltaproteobacteria bacterium]|nr:molybdate ABC transporter substrate-binding protein [Deltaproteobacteria bacterium]